MLTNIDLFLITKDNQDIIIDTLRSYRNSVLRYFIYDDGSTDDTIKNITEYFKENKIKEYYIITSSINDILDIIEDVSEYVLYVNPHERLEGDIKIHKRLTDRAYLVRYKTNNKFNNVPQIFSCNAIRPFILSMALNHKDLRLINDDFYISTNNYQLLLKHDYFKAEMYMLSGKYEEAKEIFHELATTTTNKEIRYACIFGMAFIKHQTSDNIQDIENTYLQVFNIDSSRAEPLFILAKHYSKQRDFEKAYTCINLIKDLKYPKTEAYGIIRSIYDHEILDELSIISFYVGRFKESVIASKKLLCSDYNQKDRIKNNSQFSINAIQREDILVYAPNELSEDLKDYLTDLVDIYNIYLVSDYPYNIRCLQFKTRYINDIISKKDFYCILSINNFDLQLTDSTFNVLLLTKGDRIVNIDDLLKVNVNDSFLNSYSKNFSYVLNNLNRSSDGYYLLTKHTSPPVSIRKDLKIETTELYDTYFSSLPKSGICVKDILIKAIISARDTFGLNEKICELLGDCLSKCGDFIEAKRYYDEALSISKGFNSALRMKIAKCLSKYDYSTDIYKYLDPVLDGEELENVLKDIPNEPIKGKLNVYVISRSPNNWIEFINNHDTYEINFIRKRLLKINPLSKQIIDRFQNSSFNLRKDIISFRLTSENILHNHNLDQNVCIIYEDVIINDLDEFIRLISDKNITCAKLSDNIIHGYVLNPSYIEDFSLDSDIADTHDILNVHGDPYPDFKLKEFENYSFYSGLDSNGYDIRYVGKLPIEKLKELADEDDTCIGFNTFGWLKYKIRSVYDFSILSDNIEEGLYVKNVKQIIDGKIKKIIQNKGKSDSNLTFTVTTCKRLDYFTETMNKLLLNCKDIEMIDDWICIDDNSTEEDRKVMQQRYPFFHFIMKDIEDKGHARSMNILFDNVKTDYVMHFEDDWECNKPFKITNILNFIKGQAYGQVILRKICWADHIPITIIDDVPVYKYVYNPKHTVKPQLNVEYDKNFELKEDYGANQTYWWWPGFTLNPSIFNISMLRDIGKFKEDIMQELFEYDYATRVYLKGIEIAYINLNIEHIGLQSSYSLNDMKRYYDK